MNKQQRIAANLNRLLDRMRETGEAFIPMRMDPSSAKTLRNALVVQLDKVAMMKNIADLLAKVQEQQLEINRLKIYHQYAIHSMRDQGYAVVYWTPSQLGNADAGHLEEILQERGENFIEQNKE